MLLVWLVKMDVVLVVVENRLALILDLAPRLLCLLVFSVRLIDSFVFVVVLLVALSLVDFFYGHNLGVTRPTKNKSRLEQKTTIWPYVSSCQWLWTKHESNTALCGIELSYFKEDVTPMELNGHDSTINKRESKKN